MGIRRGPGTTWILLAACVGFAGAAQGATCTGPQALTAKLRAHPTTENAISLGNWFASNKQFQCAADTFRGAIKADPQSAQLYYLEGVALVALNRPAEALPAMEESVRLESDVIKPHLMLAHLYDLAAQHEKAEEQWKQALGIDPHAVPALEGLSADLLARQDYMDVIGLLQNAPRTEKLAINLSQALGMLNYLDEANKVLTEALKLSPGSVSLASAMTVVLVKQLRYEDAIHLLQQTIQKNPGNQEAEVQLFRVLVLTNHINLARPMGPKLLAQRPHDSEVLYLNGIVERSVGDYAQAKTHLETAVAIDPGFFNSRYNLGMVLVFLHEWKEAAEQLEKAIALGATEPQAHFELAKALRGLGEDDRALAEMKQYQQLKKTEEAETEAGTDAAQGDTELAAGKVTEATAHYREAADGQPDNADYKFKLAIALHRAGDTPGERAQLESAVKLKPDLAGAQEQLGYLLSRSGEAEGAIEHFRLAVRATPAWVEAWINLAGELAECGHFAEARDAVATALRLDPGNTAAHELSDQLARDPAAQQAHP
jgi:tetratricopeptide (TPR) repeat protein